MRVPARGRKIKTGQLGYAPVGDRSWISVQAEVDKSAATAEATASAARIIIGVPAAVPRLS